MKKSFTLLELMISIAILGIISGLIYGNFVNSLKKARDAKRKADLEQIQRALEMYYEDKKRYPVNLNFGDKLCETRNCLSNEKIYMQKIPNDPVNNKNYVYESDGTYYRLFSCIENNLDQGPGVKQNGYVGTNCGNCGSSGLCKYGISSPNTNLP